MYMCCKAVFMYRCMLILSVTCMFFDLYMFVLLVCYVRVLCFDFCSIISGYVCICFCALVSRDIVGSGLV